MKDANVDTAIRHVTRPGTNLFRDLGFSAKTANHLHLQLRQEIELAKAKTVLRTAGLEPPKS